MVMWDTVNQWLQEQGILTGEPIGMRPPPNFSSGPTVFNPMQFGAIPFGG